MTSYVLCLGDAPVVGRRAVGSKAPRPYAHRLGVCSLTTKASKTTAPRDANQNGPEATAPRDANQLVRAPQRTTLKPSVRIGPEATAFANPAYDAIGPEATAIANPAYDAIGPEATAFANLGQRPRRLPPFRRLLKSPAIAG